MSPNPRASTAGSGACKKGLGDVEKLHEPGPSLAFKKMLWSQGAKNLHPSQRPSRRKG